MQQVNIHEAKTQLSRLIELTQAGQEFIIAKAGKPVARLTPIDRGKPPRRLGLLDGQIRVPDDFNTPLPDAVLDAFEGRG
ncbi:MAG: type II toxin-antitoxin system Phd/YefM family antitoxin [Candidatus Competibacteraceae bacterium]|nr:type II toxin-antitoxin system Phd/YefM family antitoxin [Candidatus Competibacteraceae bacterium]